MNKFVIMENIYLTEVSNVGHPIIGKLSLVEITLLTLFSSILLFFLKIKNASCAKVRTEECADFVESLPGPKSFFPFIGNAFQLLPLTNNLNVLLKWSLEYGSVFKFHLAGHTMVVLNSASAVQALFKSSNVGHLPKLPLFYNEFKTYTPNGLIVSKGQSWKINRKILMQSVSYQNLKDCVPLVNKHCSRLVHSLSKLFRDDQPRPINELINVTLFDVINEMITGVDLHNTQEGKEFHHILLKAEEIMTQRVTQPWLQVDLIWKYHPLSRIQKDVINYANNFAHKIIGKRRLERAAMKANEESDRKQHFRSIVDILLDEEMTNDEIAQELLVMFVAGHETSAAALHFFCFMMALNPKCQDECRQEVDAMFDNMDLSQDTDISWDVLNNMKYVEQAILETLRLFPTVFLIGRCIEEALTIGKDKELPSGTNIVVSAWTMHRNPKYFPNPDTFDPNRFSPEENAERPPYAFIPFAAGQRNCLGFKFAMIELKVAAAHILRRFVLSTENKRNEIPLLPNVILKASKDYSFSFKKRC